jgi:luciferase family oxidoreductase group 1
MLSKKMQFSILDLCPILSGEKPEDSLKHPAELARYGEQVGYKRFWMAEHHNMPGIGSSAPEILIAHVAQATRKIRVGSGGIMLPNHATLHIAEVFRTLEALYPGRIDLGIGRAPGSGSRAAAALRHTRNLSADDFPDELDDLLKWMTDELPQTHRYGGVSAVPINVHMPDLWILGSSDFGAMLAAEKGLPYAFAQHFSHLPALEILKLYHERFRPSRWLEAPRCMLGVHIICAETDELARDLAMSSDLSFSIFVQTGKSIPLPTVEEAKHYSYSADDWKQVRAGSMPKFVGSPETIQKSLSPYLKSGIVDELMILSMIHDQEARKNSYRLLSEIYL